MDFRSALTYAQGVGKSALTSFVASPVTSTSLKHFLCTWVSDSKATVDVVLEDKLIFRRQQSVFPKWIEMMYTEK